MTNKKGPLFGFEIDGERKDLFGSLASALTYSDDPCYHVAAPSAAWAGLLSATGNLYHHSLEIVIAKAGKPKAKLVPYQPPRKKRRFGRNLLGITYIADDFDGTLPPEMQKYFE